MFPLKRMIQTSLSYVSSLCLLHCFWQYSFVLAKESERNFRNSTAYQVESLVSYWKLDGDASDFKDGNHGTLYGDPQFMAGKVDSAVSLDGIDDYIEFLETGNLIFRTSDFTIMAWIYPTAHI